MQNLHWRKRPLLYTLLITAVLYLLLRLRTYKYEASVVLLKVQPIVVWEYVADFSNMKYLNPTIVDFNVLHESGNYEHWKYSVVYTEHLSHWPYLENRGVADFDIKAEEKKNIFYIESTHKTCIFNGNFCVNSKSTFKFLKNTAQDTTCQEYIEYQCPVLLSSFCLREVEFQRTAIMTNLRKLFQK